MSSPGVGRLEGRVVVVAGGGGGTGRASALRLASEGARVVVGDIDGESAQSVAEEARAQGADASACTFDFGDPDSVRALIGRAHDLFARLDGLHNVAGNPTAMGADHDLLSTTEEVWRSQLDGHLLAYAHACRVAIPLMIESGGGSIVNTSSASARSAETSRIGYQTAKTGVETLTRHIAHTYGKRGIRCNTIAYGVVLTERLVATLPQEFLDRALEGTWSPRLGRTEDIAAMAALLLSSDGEWVNGQVIDVNGGRLLGP